MSSFAMISFVLMAAALCLLTVALLTRPLWRRDSPAKRRAALTVAVFVGAVAGLGAWGLHAARPVTPSDEAARLADDAVALAVAQPRQLQGDAKQLAERALVLDPRNPKALSLAGTAAFTRRDYAGAVAYWEELLRTQPGNSRFARQVQPSLAEARRLAAR
jgi:cytochrome c-type biogenesis protein CcmH/NrfG